MTKILLVEDDKSLREIYGVRLLAEGYDIVSAGDGEEALATAIKEKPDLIVSDVMMPKISGFDMLDILRSTPETKDIKVIMMTALSSEDQRDRGEKLGADRYLVKSQVGIEDVVRTVHEVLGDAPVAAPQFSSMQPQQQPQQQPAQQPQQQASEPEPEQLPQPTAPFSSPRPATLGERIIHPIESDAPQASADNGMSLADRISAELEQSDTSAPAEQPQVQAESAPEAQPQQYEQPQAQAQAPQQQEQPQAQPEAQQQPAQPEMQMPQTQQLEQPQMQPQQAPQMPQPEMQQPQVQPAQPTSQPQMQQQPVQPQQQHAPTESPQPLQIDPNVVDQSRSSFNVPPRQ